MLTIEVMMFFILFMFMFYCYFIWYFKFNSI